MTKGRPSKAVRTKTRIIDPLPLVRKMSTLV